MKRTQIRRRIVAFILMAMMVMEIPLPVYAETENKVLQHIDVEGKTYDYYLDDVGNPYMIIDGEKMYVALPLAHLRVTDPQKIEELNSAVSESTMTRAVPTKYYDISSGGAEVINSPVYSKNVDFGTTPTYTTEVLKANRQHAAIRFKTSNIKKENIFAGSKVNFTIYYYDVVDDAWYAEEHSDVDCTGATGFGVLFSPTITEYLQFDVSKSSKIKSLTLEIWTTVLW